MSNADKIIEGILKPKPKINPVEKAEQILQSHKIIYCANEFYEYRSGYYKKIQDLHICQWILNMLNKAFTKTRSNEILHCIKTKTLLELEMLNRGDLMNVKNGMVDTKSLRLLPHGPEYYSTIRLNVEYGPEHTCERWIEVLTDMFEGDHDKVRALQEYFGLCLTKSTEYEKSLFLVGEGRNGKSVVLYVLCELLGQENYSAVSLDMFDKSHYVASMFGKLANVSIETKAKTSIYDSMFKAIVSGDPIEADRKYQASFVFRPFCKMIFATNNLPRVEDKTDAFYKRLLILKFNKQYLASQQDKRLKYDLVGQELSGIFMWALEGLRRLRERGDFAISVDMLKEIQDYQEDNNNVIMFCEDNCDLSPGFATPISLMYDEYKAWCHGDGYKPLGKKNYVREICKHYKNVKRIKSGGSWKLEGICLLSRVEDFDEF